MAMGIASTAAQRDAPELSAALLVVGCVAFVVLSARAVAAAARRPGAIAAELRSLPEAFDALTLVAAAGVLSVRLHAAGYDAVAAGGVALAAWPVLVAAVAAAATRSRASRGVSGNWLLAVVATQSVAMVAAVAALSRDVPALTLAAVAAWCVGLVLYVGLIGPVAGRLAHMAVRREFTPDFWIVMGALAISTLAAAALLRAPGTPAEPLIKAAGLTTLVVAATWIPALTAIDLRAVRMPRRPPASGRWSMVFPLGMFSASAQAYGRAAGMPALTTVGDWSAWVALLAWLAVAIAAIDRWRTRRPSAP
jgi:tellurite resistance protein TehA-like permease